ncbi:exported hypothetical protein [Cupriavidus taiwanensis]|uniref:Uncharacterized protein n=1 Tax=Cupriavidus taiwanensis TaxID=164546 RepID=A0A375CE29_9BURK|nr:exported hypothetical protein [Cupriavidus taiwanensis]
MHSPAATGSAHMLQAPASAAPATSQSAPFGDYPLQRTTTLHSPGVFHMLQFRSYKYLDQISAESKALAT